MESRSFDGHKVEQALARLAGTFSVDANDAEYLRADQTVVAVVVARLSGESSQIMKRTGVVRRTDVLDVTQFAVVHEPELQALLRAHMPQLEHPEPLAVPQLHSVPTDQAVQWVPPSTIEGEWLEANNWEPPVVPTENTDVIVTVVEPDEEEVFSPGAASEQRMPVGGSRKNDPLLARFMDGLDR